MTTEILNSNVNSLKIGDIFTPQKWAEFAIEKYNLLNEWLNGKTIFDPSMGEGNLLFSLVDLATKKGYSLHSLPLKNLYGNELNRNYFNKAIKKFKNDYNVNMNGNFSNRDFILYGKQQFDILFGNPPWCNFVDLPSEYKEFSKPYFFKYNLIENSQKLLLGGSRIDIAALVIQKAVTENLKENGKAIFFLPLSLFLNNGVHNAFRKFKLENKSYSLEEIYDLDNLDVFENIGTRYGIGYFTKKESDKKLIPYFRFEKEKWQKYNAIKGDNGNPFLISKKNNFVKDLPKINVPEKTKPRQGINPCGAINIFVFKEYEQISKNMCLVNKQFKLPIKFIYPLITSDNFKHCLQPKKWVLLPYNKETGKPLSKQEIEQEQFLADYLEQNKFSLINRKGTIINAHIKRGIWWAMLGVGAYNFLPYKVVWEAYGKSKFNPQIFADKWQANQSLQAFIPCSNKQNADKLLKELSNPKVEEFLLSSRMEGTMNWAQPGKISQILREFP